MYCTRYISTSIGFIFSMNCSFYKARVQRYSTMCTVGCGLILKLVDKDIGDMLYPLQKYGAQKNKSIDLHRRGHDFLGHSLYCKV
jgi:hypothetical protein